MFDWYKNMSGATYVKNSKNSKLSTSNEVDATYASIKASCSNTCPLRDEGCYAQLSFTGYTNTKLDREADGFSALQIARAEAKAIDASYDKVPDNRLLRIHVSGDSKTVAGTRLLNSAVKRWKKRGGKLAWTYTHSWANVHRKNWSEVSVLASIENVAQVKLARAQGYAPAIIVNHHISDKTYKLKGSNIKWIPCPAQTNPNGKDIKCADCKLCFNANRLYENNFGIAFAVHGVKQNNIKRRLKVLP